MQAFKDPRGMTFRSSRAQRTYKKSHMLSLKKSRPGSGGDVSTSDDTFDILRRLLARKADIEQRIAASIQGLELAVQTTSRELQVVLTTRAAAVTATSTSTDPVNH